MKPYNGSGAVPWPDPLMPELEEDDEEEPFVNEYDDEFMDEIHKQIPKWIAVLAVTMITAFVGNLFLAFIIAKSPRRRLSPVQILILHTCVADIMFALCTVLPQMASFLTFPNFYGGDFLCRCVKYLQLIPMYASPYLLIAISIDRYIAVCKPFRAYRIKHNLVHYLAGTAWFLSFVFSSPNLIVFRFGYWENSTIVSCLDQMEPWQQKFYTIFYAICAWLIPSLTAGVLYSCVCYRVWNSDKIKLTTVTQGSLRKSTNALTYHKIKTVKLTMTIVACNFVLLAPFCLIHVLCTFIPELTENFIIVTSIMLIGNANSCVNPWIYVVFNYKQIYAMCVAPSNRMNSQRYRTIMLSVRSSTSFFSNSQRRFSTAAPRPSLAY